MIKVSKNFGYINYMFFSGKYILFDSKGTGTIFDAYNNILFEVSGAIHTGSARLKSTNYKIDVEYKTYTFSIGYVF